MHIITNIYVVNIQSVQQTLHVQIVYFCYDCFCFLIMLPLYFYQQLWINQFQYNSMLSSKPIPERSVELISSINSDTQLESFTVNNLQTGLSQNTKDLIRQLIPMLISNETKKRIWDSYFDEIGQVKNKLLQNVIKSNRSEIIRLLTQYPVQVSNFRYIYGWSLLHFSVRQNNQQITQILLKHGINIDIQSSEMRRTALHEAVLANNTQLTILLINFGANPNLIDADRNTAIHFCVDYGYLQILKTILSSRIPVDIHMINSQGMTAIDNCRTANILQILFNYDQSICSTPSITNDTQGYNYQSRLRIHQNDMITNFSRVDQVQKFLYIRQSPIASSKEISDFYQSGLSSEFYSDINNDEEEKVKKKIKSNRVGSLRNKSLMKSCKKASQNIGLRRQIMYQTYIKDQDQIENYQIIKKLGAGSFSQVFMVRKKKSSSIFAMKKIDKKLVYEKKLQEYVRTEKFVLTQINHPFILKGFACLQDFYSLYIVMQLCQGGDMEKLIRQSTLTQKRAKTYVCEASLALDELHSHEIIYRDLKVSNVMLDKTGHLKLGDFGLAKRALCTDSFVGSTCYLPPELIAPGLKKIHDKSVDWYLLGVFLYQLLHGEPIFYNENLALMQARILNEQPTYHNDTSLQCQQVMSKLLNKNPQNRLSSLDDLKALKWFEDVDWQKIMRREGQTMNTNIQWRQTRRKDYFSVQQQYKQIDSKLQWYNEWNYPLKYL